MLSLTKKIQWKNWAKWLNVGICWGRVRLKVRLWQLYNWRCWIRLQRSWIYIRGKEGRQSKKERECDRHKHLSRDGSLHAHYLACSCWLLPQDVFCNWVNKGRQEGGSFGILSPALSSVSLHFALSFWGSIGTEVWEIFQVKWLDWISWTDDTLHSICSAENGFDSIHSSR